jgi:hypothetical protein
MKYFLCTILVGFLLLFTGCKNKYCDISDEHRRKVIKQAIDVFDQNNSQGHSKYSIKLSEKDFEWVVIFEGKIPYPGNHALVIIDKETGQATYHPGQ